VGLEYFLVHQCLVFGPDHRTRIPSAGDIRPTKAYKRVHQWERPRTISVLECPSAATCSPQNPVSNFMTGFSLTWYLTFGNSSKDIFDGRDRQALDKSPRVHQLTHRNWSVFRSNFPFHWLKINPYSLGYPPTCSSKPVTLHGFLLRNELTVAL
jgi:hypothetical protein